MASFGDGVATFSRAADGSLTQPGAANACITPVAAPGCAAGCAVGSPVSVAVSPGDGTVYLAGEEGVAVFSRGATGLLTQLTGAAAASRPRGAAARPARAMAGARSVAVSPDGASVYVAAETSSAVAVSTRRFRRAGTEARCRRLRRGGTRPPAALGTARSAGALSGRRPNGQTVYAASRAPTPSRPSTGSGTGELTTRPFPTGCVSNHGGGVGCRVGRALDGAIGVVVDPAGTSAYVTGQPRRCRRRLRPRSRRARDDHHLRPGEAARAPTLAAAGVRVEGTAPLGCPAWTGNRGSRAPGSDRPARLRRAPLLGRGVRCHRQPGPDAEDRASGS